MSGHRGPFSVSPLWAVGLWAVGLSSGSVVAAAPPPGLDPDGLKAWTEYQKEPLHRAFAIAPGGQWGWRSGLADTEQATDEALGVCQQENELACLTYDLNGRKVLTAERWEQALAPYPVSASQIGTRRGQRFPDIRLQTPDGQAIPLVQPGTRVTILHFWGSWCPPCVKELPGLAQTQRRLDKDGAIRFALVPLREPLATSQTWLRSRKLNLNPLLAETASPTALRLGNGKVLADRQIAPVFPTTYILDGRGTILFVKHGAIHDWASLIPILRHAARNAAQ